MSEKEDYDTDTSLSSAKTDVKVVKAPALRQTSENYTDNIEPRELNRRDSPKLRSKRRSWINTDSILLPKHRDPPHFKSDGEDDTPNTESESVKRRRARAPFKHSTKLPSNTDNLRRDSTYMADNLRRDSTYMDYHKGRRLSLFDGNTDSLRRDSTFMEYYNGRKYKAVNGWKIPLEIKCLEIGNECETFRWLHNKNAIMLGGRLTNTNLAIAIVGALGTVSVLVDYISNNYYKDVIWIDPFMKLITFILTLTVTIISIIQRTYDFAQKIELHRNAERRHVWLLTDIQSQLQKNPKDRTSGDDYFKWITHELNNIADSNDIDDDVIKEFYETFQDTKIPGLDTMNQLRIYMEDEDESSSKASKKTIDKNLTPASSTLDLNNAQNSQILLNSTLPNNVSNNPQIAIDIPVSNTPNTPNSPNTPNIPNSPMMLGVSEFTGGHKASGEMSALRNKRPDDNDVRHFRERRVVNMLNLTTNTNIPRFYNESHKIHNSDMMEYEMRRMKVNDE